MNADELRGDSRLPILTRSPPVRRLAGKGAPCRRQFKTNDATMYVVTVVFEAISGRSEALKEALLVQAENSLRYEDSCLRFDVSQDLLKDGRFFLYEIYEDEAAFDAHLESPYYKSFSEATAPMVASKTIERWSLISETP